MSLIVVVDTTRPKDKNFNDDLINAIHELGYELVVVSYVEAAEKIKQIKGIHSIIIAGVPLHYPAKSAEDLRPYLQPWLEKTTVPVLGICLGHQAMGLVYGAKMRRKEEIEDGLVMTEIVNTQNEDPIFRGLGKRFKVASSHWASISIINAPHLTQLARSLPEAGISNGCENQIIRVAGQQKYGVQFHPEKSEIGKLFLSNFFSLQSVRKSVSLQPTPRC